MVLASMGSVLVRRREREEENLLIRRGLMRGSQAHLAEVAHQEGGVGAAGLDGDAAGVVEQEGEPPQVLVAEGEVWVEKLPSSGERMARVKESLLTSIPTSF